MSIIVISLCFLALIIASISDLKTREVPDWLNYGLIIAGFVINGMFSIVQWHPKLILYSMLGFAITFIIALIMFYTGQWGGGDAKMLMGLGALIGFNLKFEGLFVSFLLAILFIGAIYGLLWSLGLALRDFSKFFKRFREIMHEKTQFRIRITCLSLSTIAIISVFIVKDNATKLLLVSTVILLYFMLYLYFFIKSVEEICMYKQTPTSKLTEGDWIAEDVKKGKRVIASKKDLGISLEQINLLKKLQIKKVLVKQGIPFTPSFLFSFLFAVVYGNILTIVIQLV
jgi:Flp pilus assembly protein protease CpaA